MTPYNYLKQDLDKKVQEALLVYEDAHRGLRFTHKNFIYEMHDVVNKSLVLTCLRKSHGNCSYAADLLGVNRNTLRGFMKRYNINHEDFKDKP